MSECVAELVRAANRYLRALAVLPIREEDERLVEGLIARQPLAPTRPLKRKLKLVAK